MKKIIILATLIVGMVFMRDSVSAAYVYNVEKDEYAFEDDIGILAEVDMDKKNIIFNIKKNKGKEFTHSGVVRILEDGSIVAEENYTKGENGIVLEVPLDFSTDTHAYQAYIEEGENDRIWTGETIISGRWEKNPPGLGTHYAGDEYENPIYDDESVPPEVDIIEGDYLEVELGEEFTLHAIGENVEYYFWRSPTLEFLECGENVTWVKVLATTPYSSDITVYAGNGLGKLVSRSIKVNVLEPVETISWRTKVKNFISRIFRLSKNESADPVIKEESLSRVESARRFWTIEGEDTEYTLNCYKVVDELNYKYVWYDKFKNQIIKGWTLETVCYNAERNQVLYSKNKDNLGQLGIYDIQDDSFEKTEVIKLGLFEMCSKVKAWHKDNSVEYICSSGDAGYASSTTHLYNFDTKEHRIIESCSITPEGGPDWVCEDENKVNTDTFELFRNEKYGYEISLPDSWKAYSPYDSSVIAESPSEFPQDQMILTGPWQVVSFQIDVIDDKAIESYVDRFLSDAVKDGPKYIRGQDIFYMVQNGSDIVKIYSSDKDYEYNDLIFNSLKLIK